MRKGILFVVSGPSGSGKTTLCRMVEKELGIPHSVSYTTRGARSGEADGKDYHFISSEDFEEKARLGGFLEWAHVHGNRYGTGLEETRKAIEAGQDLILDLDTQGALEVKSKMREAVLIFIDAPDDHSLAARLGKRGTEAEEAKQKRLAQAEHERKSKAQYDYAVTNDELDQTYNFILGVIERERELRKASS